MNTIGGSQVPTFVVLMMRFTTANASSTLDAMTANQAERSGHGLFTTGGSAARLRKDRKLRRSESSSVLRRRL